MVVCRTSLPTNVFCFGALCHFWHILSSCYRMTISRVGPRRGLQLRGVVLVGFRMGVREDKQGVPSRGRGWMAQPCGGDSRDPPLVPGRLPAADPLPGVGRGAAGQYAATPATRRAAVHPGNIFTLHLCDPTPWGRGFSRLGGGCAKVRFWRLGRKKNFSV